jgi:hypothetical protein
MGSQNWHNREDQKSITISNSQCLHFHDESVCGERESVHHVLLDRPQFIELRQGLREKVGDVFNNMSTLLEDREKREEVRLMIFLC